MFEAIERGEIKALWVMGDQSGRVAARARTSARRHCASSNLFVVSETSVPMTLWRRAPCPFAGGGWGEKDGTVTNSERRISRQRSFLPLPRGGAARLVESSAASAQRLAFAGSPIAVQPTIFREHAACRLSRTMALATSISAA